tara:strand:+ start:163 stop:552 length:390 start_codon:yes stop_codon:yes gene_type:complete
MANVNPHKEEIIERMKELIREGKPRDFVVDTIKDEFKGLVHKNTPYEWWKDIIKQQDIQEWEKENKKEVMSLYDHKRKAKIDMYYWTYIRYIKKKNQLENSKSKVEDPELIKEIYDLQDRLQPYLKKVE